RAGSNHDTFPRPGAGHEGERPVLDNSFRRLSRFAAVSGNPLALAEESRSRRLPAIYTETGGYRGPPALRILRSRRNARGKALMDWQAFWLTIRLAVLVAMILIVIGLPIAYWITYSRWRWKFLVEAVVALPIVLPPTVLGFYLLIALGPRSPLGRWWQALTGHTLAFTFEGLVIVSILYRLPVAVHTLLAAVCTVD